MLAAAAIVLGLLLGWASGGSLGGLRKARLRHEGVVLVLFVMQAVARSDWGLRAGLVSVLIWGTCSVALLVVCIRMSDLPGLPVAGAGVAANGLVILLNGAMPVTVQQGYLDAARTTLHEYQGFYVLADRRTMLGWLGDVLQVGNLGLVSLGDMLLAVGLCAFLVNAMLDIDDEFLTE